MAGEPIYREHVKGPPEWLVDRRQAAIADCRIFYTGAKKPAAESLMCFSWECGAGWYDALARLSYRIEALNLEYYPKYRIRCEAEQVKEKFGTLRVYTRIVIDPPRWRVFLPNALQKIVDWVVRLKLDYGLKKVVDSPKHIRYEYEQMTKSDFDNAVAGKCKCSNVEYLEDSGRYYKVTALDIYMKYHTEPTRHRIVCKTVKVVNRIISLLRSWAIVEPSASQRVISEYMDLEVEECVKAAEGECYCICEDCGTQIGNHWHPRCEMRGWTAYVCEDCAARRGGQYVKHEPKTDDTHEDQD